MEEIRHISTSFQGSIIALAEFEKNVQIIDISKSIIISEFETIMDFGGERLAISDDGQICICGCWERFGICGYNTNTGNLIWQRKDLKKVQKIQTLRSNNGVVFTQFEIGSSRLLDIKTGRDIDKIVGVKNYYESKFQLIDIYDKSAKIELIDRSKSKVIAKIERQSWATLDIAFTPDSILISEAGGPMSCYDSFDGKLKWRIKKNKEEHYLRVSFNEELGVYIALSRPFEHIDKKLIYINCNTGIIEHELIINQPCEAEFMFDGQLLVTSERNTISLKTGEIKKWL